MIHFIATNQWVISLGSGIIGAVIASLVIYYGFGIGKPKNIVLNPKVSFYPKGPYQNGAVFLEIYNSGNEDVEDIQVTTRYQKYDGQRQVVWEERNIDRYINETDNPIMASPSPLNVLRVGEKKLGSGFRNTAINKLVEVKVSCVGMTSGRTFETSSILETARAEL